MKNPSLIIAFIAFTVASMSTQSCAKTVKTKAQNSVVVASSSVSNMPKIEDKKSVDIVAEKAAEMPVKVAEKPMVEKAIVAEIDTQKKVAMPQKIEKIVTSKSVVKDTSKLIQTTEIAVVNSAQVIDNKAVTIEKPIVQEVKKEPSIHETWNDLLKKHVSSTGKVDYKGFKADLDILDTYIRSLNDNAPSESASKNDRLAYWINAYNAVTVRLIVSNYPITSITKIDGGKTWDVKRYSNGSKKLSLNDIENNILRPMGDARVHFALNCAAKSCPPIYNEAFTAENVNKLLEQRTKQFVNSSRMVIEKEQIKLPKIFEWYAKDFGNVVEFVNKYAKTKASKTAKVVYLDYDWGLNE